jgi:predicted acyl esterase
MLQGRDGRCDWRVANWWPPRRGYTPLYLQKGGGLGRERPTAAAAIGQWTWNPLAGQGEDLFSKWDNAAFGPQRDGDQAVEDEWKGITFSTPRLEDPLVVRGPIVLSLKAATRPFLAGAGLHLGPLAKEHPGLQQLLPPYHDTDFVVKLSDVAPGGRSTLVQSGYLRASHRILDPARTVRNSAGDVIQPVHFHDEGHLAPAGARAAAHLRDRDLAYGEALPRRAPAAHRAVLGRHGEPPHAPEPRRQHRARGVLPAAPGG